MKISVIVPTYNRPADMERLLDSIVRQERRPSEVIVVDQSDGGETGALLARFQASDAFRDIKFVWLHREERGSAKARNAGFRASSGDLVCFTDDDVLLDPGYLKSIADYFAVHPEVGGISGGVEVRDSPAGFKWVLRKVLLKIFLIDTLKGRFTASGFGFPVFLHQIREVTPVQLFAGYSMNFRRPEFERESFDEWFTGYSFREDVDLSYRISRHTTLVMIPEARFVHNHSAASRMDLRTLKEMQFRNYFYVFKKHRGGKPFAALLFGYSVAGFLLISFIEVWSGFSRKKWNAFSADCLGVMSLLRRQPE